MAADNDPSGFAIRLFLTSMFHASVAAADPLVAIGANLPDKPRGRTVVVGAGKASAQMARALEQVWDGPLSGAVVTRYGFECPTQKIEVLQAAHPVPDLAGVDAAQKLLSLISTLSADDLVIALISGGGSSLLPAPPSGLSLADEKRVNEVLLASGAPISAMNIVRKHLSTIKGGRLAASTKARVISFILSDVPGDHPEHVASGPTVPSFSSRFDALDIVEQYRLDLPASVMSQLNSPYADGPAPSDAVFGRHEWHIIASAGMSLRAAAAHSRSQGIEAVILSDSVEGEAADAALIHAAIARQIWATDAPFKRPVVLLSGGETTVTIRDRCGRGGRNGEFALSFANAIDGFSDIHLLAADTDGIDGSETNAGAFVDGTTCARLRKTGLNPRRLLGDHDSYRAFSEIGDLFETGPTGTNVNDFRAIMIGQR